jgi:hypothetical protein
MFSQFAYTANTAADSAVPSAHRLEPALQVHERAQMVGMDEEFPEFHGRVRFDSETRKGSVLDVIHVMTGQERKNCSVILQRLSESHPELIHRFENIQINSKVRQRI